MQKVEPVIPNPKTIAGLPERRTADFGIRRGNWRAYALSLLCVAAAILVRMLLDNYLASLPFIIFIAPVLAAAVYGGLAAGLFSTAISIGAGWYLFVDPRFTVLKGSPADLFRMFVFALAGTCISILSARLLRTRDDARRSELRFRSTFENTAVGMGHVSTDGHWIRVNQRLCEITGYSREQLLSLSFNDITHPDDLEADWTYARALLAGALPHYSMEKRYRHKDGRWIWVNLTVSLQRDQMGDPEYFISVVEDIGARRLAEENVRQQARLLDLSHDPIMVTEPDGVIKFWNRGAELLYGWTREEAVGKLSPDLLRTVYSSSMAAVQMQLEQHASWIGELTHTARNGRTVVVESYQELVGSSGSDRFVLVTDRDITERKRVEHMLRVNLTQLQATFDGMVEPALLADPQGSVIAMNSAYSELFDFDQPPLARDMLLGDVEYSNADGSPMDDRQSPFAQAMRGEAVRNLELTGRHRKTGRVIHIVCGSAPVRDSDGRVAAVIITSHDVTERKLSEQALQRSNDVLRQFAYAAAHDLQEPLRNVSISTELLSRRYAGKFDAEADRLLDVTVEGAQRMHRMVRDLLEYTKVIDGVSAKPELVDSETALKRALANLDQMILSAGGSITHDRLPKVRMHETHLVQLFQNLISNSLKYRKADIAPEVHVAAVRSRAEVVFCIRDNGIGFDPVHSKRIFGLFKRLHARTEYPGTGIGLAICTRIVEHYGGRIWADGRSDGASFYFAIPSRGSSQ